MLRGYYTDSYRTEFEAKIIEVTKHAGQPAIVLTETYFYPTSGGQPNDRGWIVETPVVDVVERERDGAILHVLATPLPDVGAARVCRIDWPRRFDHMQQHTAQHILSAACAELLNAPTVGFHLSAEASTIDIALSALSSEQATLVEDRANAVVEANIGIRVYTVSPDQVDALGLRKPPTKGGEQIRVVEIGDVDRSACGGTHVARTGELGAIKIRRWEKRGQETRVEFVAGGRARRDYRWKTDVINRLATALSVKDVELGDTVTRLIDEHRERGRELQVLRNQVLDHLADALWGAAASTDLVSGGTVRVIAQTYTDRTFEELRYLAGKIAERGGAVALLGLKATDKGQLAFARSSDISVDVGKLLRETLASVGGRGGGRPEAAQGGAPTPATVDGVIDAARASIVSAR